MPTPSRFLQRHHRATTALRRALGPRPARRFQSTGPGPGPGPEPAPTQARRISRVLAGASRFLPRRLRDSLGGLRSAPLSHVGAFLVLHEVTAVLPIFGLAWAFHALDWTPAAWVLGPWAAWAEDGLRRWLPYFRRKGWLGLGSEEDAGGEEALESELREEARRRKEEEEKKKKSEDHRGKTGWLTRFWGSREVDPAADSAAATASGEAIAGEGKGEKAAAAWQKIKQVATVDNTGEGYKIGVQIAAAYAITKFLLVPRIALSLWLTPWLARGFVGFRRMVWRKRS
ncbi:putative mitochondrial seryl-tRNA synthetase protein [Rosellinia necatrix]|uniref:Putative mitochondrial seryl-tRNA synthetase protein n=1 Tax=Rosellinia necatrix TaxID=77044 RepID=A0A1W2TVN4_ROSNE|nr:putative mitochondrial seryl-tRNA synthetase protein [Rosellinia necatrix]